MSAQINYHFFPEVSYKPANINALEPNVRYTFRKMFRYLDDQAVLEALQYKINLKNQLNTSTNPMEKMGIERNIQILDYNLQYGTTFYTGTFHSYNNYFLYGFHGPVIRFSDVITYKTTPYKIVNDEIIRINKKDEEKCDFMDVPFEHIVEIYEPVVLNKSEELEVARVINEFHGGKKKHRSISKKSKKAKKPKHKKTKKQK